MKSARTHKTSYARGRAALRPLLAGAAALALTITGAAAHPHVWVTSKSQVTFDAQARVTGLRHVWTFDEGYSAYVTQGLDTNGDGKLDASELAELAKVNTESLVEFGYFTELKANGVRLDFAAPSEAEMVFEGGRATLSFVLPLARPAPVGRVLALEIYDPSYFVSFALAEGQDAVELAGAPAGCATTITRAKAPDISEQQKLSEAFFEALTAASDFGARFANRALVACP